MGTQYPMTDTKPPWLTYRELARELGISPRAAEARARRHLQAEGTTWLRRQDNDLRKTVRVLVPPDELAAMRRGPEPATDPTTEPNTEPATSRDTAGHADPHGIQAMLEALTAAHQEVLAQAKAGADALAAELRGRAERAEAAVAELRAELEAERRARQAAEAEPGLGRALRQGRARLAAWVGGRRS
jgi:hypothetical protein